MKNKNNILFLEALIMALFIFGLGILLGVFIEDARMTNIQDKYLSSRTNLLDVQTLSEIINDPEFSCEYSIKKNIEFGNKIYEDSLILTKYENSRSLKDNLLEQHRIYDLLRTIFWINSMELRDRCPEFHTLVYLYEYNEQDSLEKQKQEIFSRFAGELKEMAGEKMVLIPLAINLDIASLEVLKEKYGLEGTRLVFDEKIHVTEIELFETFEKRILEEINMQN